MKPKPTVSKESVDRIVNEISSLHGYESTISVFMRSLDKQMMEIKADIDNNMWSAVMEYGVHVDKDELLRALAYDRNQYQRGFVNGVSVGYQKGLASRWISVDEEMPEGLLPVHCLVCFDGMVGYAIWDGKEWTNQFGVVSSDFSVTHWMSIPAPPDEKENEEEQV